MNIYEYQRVVGKIDDIPELKNEFISVYETKSHQDVVGFCLLLGQHLIDLTGFAAFEEIKASFEAMKEWIDGKVNYHKARNLSFEISRNARSENDIIKVRFLRTMAQIAASPHVKYHGLWATDFAVTLINRMYPNDMDAVRKEREFHIALLQRV